MTTALEEAPPTVTDSEPILVPDAAERWAEHLKLIEEDESLTDAEKAWYSDPTVITSPEAADLAGYHNGDRIHELRARPGRPMPHPQTWLQHDFMGVKGRRNVPGWFLGRLRYYLQLRGSHVFDARWKPKLVPGMLTVDPATGRYGVVKAAPRHGRPRKFRPTLSHRKAEKT